jgi:hypothetical protein
MFRDLMGQELVDLNKSLLMKVSPPAPGRTRNALSVENERKIFLGAWKQAGHSIAANPFQGPGRRL